MARRIIISIIWPGDFIFGTNVEKLSSAALKQGVIFPALTPGQNLGNFPDSQKL